MKKRKAVTFVTALVFLYAIIAKMSRETTLRIAPPILSFWCLPKKKERAAPGGRKKKALTRTPCLSRFAVRGMASLRSRRYLEADPRVAGTCL